MWSHQSFETKSDGDDLPPIQMVKMKTENVGNVGNHLEIPKLDLEMMKKNFSGKNSEKLESFTNNIKKKVKQEKGN